MNEVTVPEEARTDIDALAAFVASVAHSHWRDVMTANAEKLADAYARGGDLAYGTYLGLLFRPVNRAAREAGFTLTPDLPGGLDRSREWSAAPDETWQQRLMWSLVSDRDARVLGALVTIVHHDHTAFRVPAAPDVFAVAASTDEDVVTALSKRFEAFATAKEFTVEVAEYLAGQAARPADG